MSSASHSSPKETSGHKRALSSTRGSFLIPRKQVKYQAPLVAQPTFSTSIQDYELTAVVGTIDDISHLYVATYKPTGQVVGLKLTDLSLSVESELLSELIDTCRNLNLCRHENILAHHSSFVEHERLWSVVDVLRVGSCKQLIMDHFPNGLPNEVLIATILRDVLRALSYMHDNHYIHANVRPDNVYMDTSGQVKLSGFYQMQEMIDAGRLRRSIFKFAGDPEWMAPEVLSQATTFNSKVDIYSLGVTALELFYGKTPFDGWPALKILLCKLQYEVPDQVPNDADGQRRPSKQFAQFVERCLMKNPTRRPSAWQLLLEDPFIKQAKDSTYVMGQLHSKGVLARIAQSHGGQE